MKNYFYKNLNIFTINVRNFFNSIYNYIEVFYVLNIGSGHDIQNTADRGEFYWSNIVKGIFEIFFDLLHSDICVCGVVGNDTANQFQQNYFKHIYQN